MHFRTILPGVLLLSSQLVDARLERHSIRLRNELQYSTEAPLAVNVVDLPGVGPKIGSDAVFGLGLVQRSQADGEEMRLEKRKHKKKHCSAKKSARKAASKKGKKKSEKSKKKKSKAHKKKHKAHKKEKTTKKKSHKKTAKTTKKASSPKSVKVTSGKGLVDFSSPNCGSSHATATDPNGSEGFLNCGISKSNPSSGWKPPQGVTLSHLAYVSLDEAMARNSVWAPCKKYVSLFEKYGEKYGIPPIMLASFALQESTCQWNESGDNGGAFGLMQITSDKCNGRGASACAEPDFNVNAGASYFKSVLDDAGGEVLVALGAYNGWFPGMSYRDATAQMYGSCCECQQNGDYLYQMLNGWMLGKTGYSMGSIRNLDACRN